MHSIWNQMLRAWGAAIVSLAAGSAVMAAPPKVVKALPDNGQNDVDPATKQIRVVFDQPMDQTQYSFVGGGERYPRTLGRPRWVNDRTCVLLVQLKPEHEYWLSINSDRFKGFRSKTGEPAEPYPIAFTTGAGKGAATRPASERAIQAAPGNAQAAKPGPRVIQASPDNGQTIGVDAKQLRIVFSQPMDPGGWSVVGGGPRFPKFARQGRWENDRTFVWDWQLDPGHEYWLTINNEWFTNFRAKTGEPAGPYPVAFRTTGDGETAPLTPEINRQSIRQLKQAIDQKYSYRDQHHLDWDKLFKEFNTKMEAAQTPWLFANVAGCLLARNQDIHVWLKVKDETVPSFRRKVEPNFNKATLARLVPGWTERSKVVATGKFEDDLGYIMIASWGSKNADELQGAYDALAASSGSKGLIVDVRPNSGGSENLARVFAGCFIDSPVVYGKHVNRENGRFSEVRERRVSPSPERPNYRGKVAVLTGPEVMSSCESFLLMMKQAPNCKLIGAKSFGASGNPQPVELANGVTVLLPCWKDLRPDGTCFEGEGIAPDIEVKTTESSFAKADPVLAAALKWLRGGSGTPQMNK